MQTPEDDIHMAVIPDGNRRYAQERGLPAYEGHRLGSERALDFLEWVDEYPSISQVTAWALSPSNHRKRPEEEIENLNRVYKHYADILNEKGSALHAQGIHVDTIGDTAVLAPETLDSVEALVEDTSAYRGTRLNIAFFYDAAYDTDQALETARADGVQEPLSTDIKDYYEIPEVDILVRYGDDSAHLSGFAPSQQIRQATLVFPGKNWPEAEREDIDRALEKDRERKRTEGA